MPTVEEIIHAFHRDGFVHLPGVLAPAELDLLRADSLEIVEGGWEGKENESDYFHDVLPDTGEDVFHRVQYIFPKARRGSFVTLLGHPLILEIVHGLLGDDFLCAAEALVFKMPGNGREVTIHTDGDPFDPQLAPLIFNVDYYLDDSSLENGCLWVEPGTHQIAHEMPRERVFRGLDFSNMIPVPVKAGDVLLHNIRLIHGSPRSNGGAMRRTLYYEFQSIAAMEKQGGPRPGHPLRNNFVEERIRLLMHAIQKRAAASFAEGETPFSYTPPAGYNVSWPQPDEAINLRPALGYHKYI
jgi:phytanoyl-CoA hydroxylase